MAVDRKNINGQRRLAIFAGVMAFFVLVVFFSHGAIMGSIGAWVVVDEPVASAEAVVVLNTGLEVYPRLIQAAEIYRAGLVDYVVINGNRKTDVMRGWKPMDFSRAAPGMRIPCRC